MQGSRIAHSVTPVLHAREPRLTLVNSYQSLNPFSEDKTIYVSFRDIEPASAPFEFARHVGWRVRNQLEYLMRAKLFGEQNDNEIVALLNGTSSRQHTDPRRCASLLLPHYLAGAATELSRAAALISRDEVDLRPYKPLEKEDDEDERAEAEQAGADEAPATKANDACSKGQAVPGAVPAPSAVGEKRRRA